jgi:hypothetical protein
VFFACLFICAFPWRLGALAVILCLPLDSDQARKAKNSPPRKSENQFMERCGQESVRLKRTAFPLTAHLSAE